MPAVERQRSDHDSRVGILIFKLDRLPFVIEFGDLTGFTSLTFLTPVFALGSGLVLLGEQLEPLQWLGVVLALASVLLINRRAELWQA